MIVAGSTALFGTQQRARCARCSKQLPLLARLVRCGHSTLAPPPAASSKGFTMSFCDLRLEHEAAGIDHFGLARALLRRAVRHTALLRATSAGLAYAPTLDDRLCSIERARERLLQLERAAEQYAELTTADLLADAEHLLGALPLPNSWPEAALAQLLLSLAGRIELEATNLNAAGGQLALACESEHANAARAALDELSPSTLPLRELLQSFATRWMSVAYATLANEQRSEYTRALAGMFGPLGIQLAH